VYMASNRTTDYANGDQAMRMPASGKRTRHVCGVLGLTIALLGCGSSDDNGPSSGALPLSVEGLLVAEPSGSVEAIGFVVIDATGARLCFALAESFPPQCGEGSLEIVNPDDLDVTFEVSGAVQWTESAVVVRGQYSQQGFTIEAPGG
jgi:hypothetical protein